MKGGLKSASIKHGGQFVVTLTGVQMMPMLCVASLDTFREVRLVHANYGFESCAYQ